MRIARPPTPGKYSEALFLLHRRDAGLFVPVRSGEICVVYQCPYPFSFKPSMLRTVYEWMSSLRRPSRIAICRKCSQPEDRHAAACFLGDPNFLAIRSVHSSEDCREVSLGPIYWSTGVVDNLRTNVFTMSLLPLAAALGLYPLFALTRGPVRRWRRQKHGRCVRCGYDLTGNTSGVCPECGALGRITA